MGDLLASDLSLAAVDLFAAKKTPVPGFVMVLFFILVVLVGIFVGYKLLRRR